MVSRIYWLAFLLTVTLNAGEVARKAEEYPARMKVGSLIIAAENLGPAVPTPSGGLFTEDYISIEVALFAQAPAIISLSHSHFSLRVNGKLILHPDTPGTVAASIKYPDWVQRPRLEGAAGAGDANVIFGRPRPVERFPGDHRPAEQTERGPMPRLDNPVSKKAEPLSIDQTVNNAALQEGEQGLPVSGCLYFPFRKKMKSIKTLELIYDGPSGAGSVRIP